MFIVRVQSASSQRLVAACKFCRNESARKGVLAPWADKGQTRHLQTTIPRSSILSDPENKGQQQRGVNFDTLGSWNNRLALPILVEQSIKKGKLIPKIPLEEVGTASFIGRRKANEDRMVIKELKENLLYIGIFDGHGSSFAADYVMEYLEHHMTYWLSQTKNLRTVLHKSFIDVNNVMTRHLAHYFIGSEIFGTGTTATVCLIHDSSELVVAHVGDSRAVLCRKGGAVRLSIDHDPDDPDETERVTKHGGRIIQNSQGNSQVNGRLGMTRSIGDTELKAYGVIAQPHLKSLEIKHGYDAFLMLATDGLSFVLSDDEMVNIISSCQTPTEAATLLADQALHFGSEDNCSVIVVPFGAWGKYIAASNSLQYRFGRNLFSKRD
ncbi:hypothetical protein BaRGS_00007509 [Batillaria attramentaria]|uniref:PPM-type phosphatase domain-containing protein n=1 Tax=Batillaria attramentaria TaxID=370345 RepID=A0ABD0LQU0_9CAEN